MTLPACSKCGGPCYFSARQRGDGLCNPCYHGSALDCPHCGASNGEHKTHGRYMCIGGTFSLSDSAARDEAIREQLAIETAELRAEVARLKVEVSLLEKERDTAYQLGKRDR